MRAAATTANMPPTIAANVTTLPADGEAEPEVSVGGRVAPGGMVAPGGRVKPGGRVNDEADGPPVGAELPKSPPLEPADGAALVMSSAEVGAAVGTPVKSPPLEPAVGAAVWSVGVGAIVKAPPREPAVGAGVAPAAPGATVAPAAPGATVAPTATGGTVGVAAGAAVKVPAAITHGAVSVHVTLAARMLVEQQSEAPLVPETSPQPTPPAGGAKIKQYKTNHAGVSWVGMIWLV